MLRINEGQYIQLKTGERNDGLAKVKKVLKTVLNVTYGGSNFSIPIPSLWQNIHGQICAPKEIMKALANRKITIPKPRKRVNSRV